MRPRPDRTARPLARGRRRLVRAGVALLAALASVAALPPAAVAANRIQSRYALGGIVRPGSPAVVEVLVEWDRVLAADLVVRSSTEAGPVVISSPVEVPGGSRKRFLVLVPAAAVDDVRLIAFGKTLASSVPFRAGERTGEVVGVLTADDKDEPPVERVRLAAVARDAEVIALPQDLLDLGAAALGPLTHVVAPAEAARALSPRQREALLGFAAAGGELIVAAAAEADLAFLPEQWRGAGRGALRRTAAGPGTVTVAMRSYSSAAWSETGESWAQTIRPAGRPTTALQQPEGAQWLSAMAEGGGFSGSRLTWLLAFVLGYVAIAGPVNFVVLSRLRRRELAWVTVPVLAVLFATGAYAAGRGVRSGPVLQATGIVVLDAPGERTTAAFGVMSRGGGRENLTLPGEWRIAPLSSPEFFGPFGASLPTIRPGRDRSEALFDLPVGGVGTALARRNRVGGGRGAGALTWDGTSYAGSVTNPAPFAIRDARVYVGHDRVDTGTLGASEQARVTLTPSPVQGGPPHEFFGFGPDGRPSFPSHSMLQLASGLAGLGQPGFAYLAGHADLEQAGPALGLPRARGRILILARIATTVVEGKRVPPSMVRRTLLSTDVNVFEGEPGAVMLHGAKDVFLRYELPTGGTGGALELRVPDDPGGGPFIGKPIPVPVLPPPDATGARSETVVVGPDGTTTVIGAEPLPDRAAQVQAGGISVSLWDHAASTWRTMKSKDGTVQIGRADRARFLRDGELLVRLRFDVPDRTIRVSSYTLEEVA